MFVVETDGFNHKTWLGTQGQPHSDEMRTIERYRRVDHNTIQFNLTIDDPKTYTKPFTVKLTQVIELDTELVDEFCLEGEQTHERMIRSRGK